ncbi:MAG TPA: hypothetical protein V6C58_00055 [Allocoleopsis sp.]
MNEITLNNKNTELTKNYIIKILEQLTVNYQKTHSEREKIASELSLSQEYFSLLEEIEILTIDIRGYASQIKARGYIANEQEAREKLQQMRIFNIPIIAQFYFDFNHHYSDIKDYLRMLDYLRLLIIEYLQ